VEYRHADPTADLEIRNLQVGYADAEAAVFPGAVPAAFFAPDSLGNAVRLATTRSGMRFLLTIENTSDRGVQLKAVIFGWTPT
jgi:hypothetical protein